MNNKVLCSLQSFQVLYIPMHSLLYQSFLHLTVVYKPGEGLIHTYARKKINNGVQQQTTADLERIINILYL